MNQEERLIELRAIEKLTGVKVSCKTCAGFRQTRVRGRFRRKCDIGIHKQVSNFPQAVNGFPGYCLEWRQK